MEYLLDTAFTPQAFAALIGDDGDGLWQRVSQAAYLESDTPNGAPFTGRQWTNDEVWRAGADSRSCGTETPVYGIERYVRMRRDRARAQLPGCADLPAGARGCGLPRCPPATARLNQAATGRRAITAARHRRTDRTGAPQVDHRRPAGKKRVTSRRRA